MGIFWTGYALSQVLVSGIGLMLPAISADLNLSAAQAGTVGAVGWILAALITVPLSAWVTRFPAKPTIAISLSGLILIHLVSAWSPDYIILLVARGLGSLMVMSTWLSSYSSKTNGRICPPARSKARDWSGNLGQLAALAGIPIHGTS
jgi:predicted MFS family arabinose efflux permease